LAYRCEPGVFGGIAEPRDSAAHEAQNPVVVTYEQVPDILRSRRRGVTLADDLFRHGCEGAEEASTPAYQWIILPTHPSNR
jgi:hypothetical protein